MPAIIKYLLIFVAVVILLFIVLSFLAMLIGNRTFEGGVLSPFFRSQSSTSTRSTNVPITKMFSFESKAFGNGAFIPERFTCDGANISLPLDWRNVPEGTQSLALIMDDPDSPTGIWLHWSVWNIDPESGGTAEGAVPKDGIQGVNSFGTVGYKGPCPNSGTHRYFLYLYALDTELALPPGTIRSELERMMQGHILSTAQLMGEYQRNK